MRDRCGGRAKLTLGSGRLPSPSLREGLPSIRAKPARSRPLHCAAVAGERVKLVVSQRAILGSAESRRLRRQGLIPGVLYGRSSPIAIAVGERDLRAALTTSAGSHAVLDVAIDGGSAHSAILKEFQRDKVRGDITHIDLQEVRLDQPIQTSVSITLVGEPVGVKEGGVLTQVTTEVNLEALPLEVPQALQADVSQLGVGETLRLGQIEVPDGVRFLDDPDETVLASVQLAREEVSEVQEAEEGEEGAEPEAAGETAEAAASEAGGGGESPSEE
jgi:large subunit ribosomal protein L25